MEKILYLKVRFNFLLKNNHVKIKLIKLSNLLKKNLTPNFSSETNKDIIDFVILSSNENPLYLDFWPIISKIWKQKFNITPVLGLICDEDSDFIKTDYGIVKKFKKIENIDCGLQSQIIRLYLPKFLDGYCLISDIDMAPLSVDYFSTNSQKINENNIIIYSSDNPECIQNAMYPMCYILAHTNTYKKIFDLNLNWNEFCFLLLSLKQGWYTDQKYLYKKINDFKNNGNEVISLARGWNWIANRRVDRARWEYDPDKIKQGYYIDSHLLRPYSKHKIEIDNLINLILDKN